MPTKTKRPEKFDAKALRDEIKSRGLHCTIPRGKALPRIHTTWGEIDFASRDEWDQYRALRKKYDVIHQAVYGRRSPLDKLIDSACGISEEQLDEVADELRALSERTKAR